MSEIFEDKIKESLEKKGIADRGLARVPVSFPVHFATIPEDEFRSLQETYISVPTRERSEGVRDSSRSPGGSKGPLTDALFEQLNRIEEKLDMLLASSGMEGEKVKRPVLEVAHANDLSGSGIRFVSGMTMSKGWYLKLSFNLPGVDPGLVTALGRVIRSGAQSRDGYFETACQFDAICEEDQDRIIAYVFRRQRELAHSRGLEP